MTDATLQLIIKLRDEASKGLDAIRGALGGVAEQARSAAQAAQSQLGGALRSVGQLAGGLALGGALALGGGLAGAATAGLSFNNSLEITSAQIQAFTKDAGQTAAMLEMVKDRASKTPFAFEEMASATAALLPAAKASGQGIENLIAQAEILAASNPAEGLEGAAVALKEALSGDYTSVIERFNLPRQRLNELKEQGVPALEAIQTAMQEIGLDADLVSGLAQTATGRWSTFKDTLVNLSGIATKPIFTAFSSGMGRVNALLEANGPRLQAMAEAIGGQLQVGIDWLASNGLPLLTAGWERLQPVLAATQTLFGQIAGGVGQLVAAFQEGGLAGVAQTVLGALQGLADGAPGALAPLLSWFETARGAIAERLATWGAALTGWISENAPAMLEQLQALVEQVGTWALAQLPGLVDNFFSWRAALLGWILDAAPAVLASLGDLLAGAIAAVGAALPGLIGQLEAWSISFLDMIVDAAPGLLRGLGGLVGQLLDAIGGALPGIVSALASWGQALIAWVVDRAPDLLGELGGMLADVLAWISERAPGILAQLGEWGQSFIAWVLPAAGQLLLGLGDLVGQLLIWIVQQAPVILEQLGEWSSQFLTWALESGLPALGEALLELARQVWPSISSRWNDAFAAGSIGEAIVESIKSAIAAQLADLHVWFAGEMSNIANVGALLQPGGAMKLAASYASTGKLPGFANGARNFGGGLAIVGERGRELVNLPPGSDVIPAPATEAILAGRGGGGVSIGSVVLQVSISEAVPNPRALAQQLVDPLREELRKIADANGGTTGY
ncbi:MAG TPA: hypothetical protein VFS21_33295 [Roseiflexaceae bacterium]|nr:hypothetical protein [Roseiflexaceae bacterium]